MSDDILRVRVHRAPNNNFYVLWQGQVVCTPVGTLRYFETALEFQDFLVECNVVDCLVDLGELRYNAEPKHKGENIASR
jgi:hypothetical protein